MLPEYRKSRGDVPPNVQCAHFFLTEGGQLDRHIGIAGYAGGKERQFKKNKVTI